MKTFMANAQNVSSQWYIVDAAGLPLGRVASQVAPAAIRAAATAIIRVVIVRISSRVYEVMKSYTITQKLLPLPP